MRFLPVNLNAMLIELDDLDQTLTLLDGLQNRPLAGVLELIPAARTILVHFDPLQVAAAELAARIGRLDITARVERSGRLVEIPVRYEGDDLEEVARILGIGIPEVIERHTGSTYTVAFTGFAPGFAYLSGGHPSLNVPRRKTPRTRIPAGAVGLAGLFSGVYPQASPGGWQIIGVTDTPMWDLNRKEPALLQPGHRVRFVAEKSRPLIAAPAYATGPAESRSTRPADARQATLTVWKTGVQALFQDLGRPGQAGQGISASGAMDRGALKQANALVGNPADCTCIELAYGGFEFEASGDSVVAVTGADVPLTRVSRDADGTLRRWPESNHAPLALSSGDRLAFGQPRAGVRAYLAVRGGFDVEPVLGSRSTDTLSNVGPKPLAAGDVVGIRPVPRGAIVGHPAQPCPDLPRADTEVTLDVVMGPRTDWFTPEAVTLFSEQVWRCLLYTSPSPRDS